MKAITLYEPWATLIAIQAKKIETRSWGTRYRGPLAIHSAMNQLRWCKALERTPFFKEALYPNGNYLYPWRNCGGVVAIVELVNCIEIVTPIESMGMDLSDQELAFGDFTVFRYMWILEHKKRLDPPYQVRGRQGLWEWGCPEALEGYCIQEKEAKKVPPVLKDGETYNMEHETKER